MTDDEIREKLKAGWRIYAGTKEDKLDVLEFLRGISLNTEEITRYVQREDDGLSAYPYVGYQSRNGTISCWSVPPEDESRVIEFRELFGNDLTPPSETEFDAALAALLS